jgi:phosphatidylglycerophosphatase A
VQTIHQQNRQADSTNSTNPTEPGHEDLAEASSAQLDRWSRCAAWIAEGCGSGRIKPAPGTWGTLAAVLAALLLEVVPSFSWWWLLIAAVVAFVVGMLVVPAAERLRGCHDPGSVVIDEWAGVWPIQAVVLATTTWPGWLAGLVAFGLFRIVDIMKPGPVLWSERLPGAWGVMVDDCVAGLLVVVGWLVVFKVVGW